MLMPDELSAVSFPPVWESHASVTASRGGERPALTPITPLKRAEHGALVLSRSLAGLLELARGVHPRATLSTSFRFGMGGPLS
jgi:hypothetical protein